MFKCNSCNNEFEDPAVVVETHTELPKDDPNRHIEWLECPYCQSNDFDEMPEVPDDED